MRVIALPAALAVLSFLSAAPVAAQASAPSAKAAGLRLLTWPGKTQAAERSRRALTHAHPRAAAPPVAPSAPPVLPASFHPPAPPAPQVPQPSAAAQPASPPVSARAQAAGRDYTTPRFYSLHRAYGQAPDPIPLSPQFLATPTQDLAEPPPRTVVTSNGQVVRTTGEDASVN